MATKPEEVQEDLAWNVTVVCCLSGFRLLALLVADRAADSCSAVYGAWANAAKMRQEINGRFARYVASRSCHVLSNAPVPI